MSGDSFYLIKDPAVAQSSQITFTEDEVKQARLFGDFINKRATFSLDVNGAIDLYKHLVAFNQLIQKIDAHILEVKKVMQQPESIEETKPVATKARK